MPGISTHTFAREMRERDRSFAGRAAAFEERFGPLDADGLALLAQACYPCWHHCAYRRDLLATCRAIGAGRPTGFSLCFQVTPERWMAMRAYLAGVRLWLGESDAAPPDVPPEAVERVRRCLGERRPAKDALAKLFLRDVAAGLKHIGVGTLTVKEPSQQACPGIVGEWASGNPLPSRETLAEEARRAMASCPADAEELITGLLAEAQPACMLRYTRHQEILLTSIGALKWRGAVPPDDGSKEEWRQWTLAYAAALESWLSGSPPGDQVASEVQALLGEPTERRKAIVRDFLLRPPEESIFFYWLRDNLPAARDGMNV